MGRLRRIAEIPAGSWTKWVVVAFWLIVLVQVVLIGLIVYALLKHR